MPDKSKSTTYHVFTDAKLGVESDWFIDDIDEALDKFGTLCDTEVNVRMYRLDHCESEMTEEEHLLKSKGETPL